MELKNAVDSLAALAHEHRLSAFRLLMRNGPEGLPAGEIAGRLELPPSSLSFHLGHLERAGLLTSRRVQRNVFYAVNVEGMKDILAYLTEDCCGGNPEICGDLAASLNRCSPR